MIGTPKAVAGTNPAANTEVVETVPAGKFWVVKAVALQLVQGLTQTPQPILEFDDGTNVIFSAFGATNAQSASTTANYRWIANGPQPAALVGSTPNIYAVSCLPDELALPGGYRVKTTTLGIGANSDYGVPRLFVVEYNDNPFGEQTVYTRSSGRLV